MNGTKIVCLANSVKHRGRCVAGIDLKTSRWVRPVSLDFPDDGRVSWKTLVHQGDQVFILVDIKPLDVLDIPLDNTGPDFGFECENLAIRHGKWGLLGKTPIDDLIPFINFTEPILHNAQRYVTVAELQARPFEERRTLELVYTDHLTITQGPREQTRDRGGTKWKGSFVTRGGYTCHNITITDPEAFDRLALGLYPAHPCLLTLSLGMPYTPPDWTGPANPCWKLIAGIIELSLADQILIQMHLLGWGLAQGRAYAMDTFGKPSRSQLTDGEKQRFIDYLRCAAAPSP